MPGPVLSIRPCTPDDHVALSLVGGATFLETYAHMIARADIIAHINAQHSPAFYAALLAEPSARCWLAETETFASPVGYLVLTAPDLPVPTRDGDVEVKRIYALSRYHGSGIGARLMDTAKAAARASGKRRLLLGVNDENARALRFYAKAGFETVGERQFTVGTTDYHDFILACSL